MTVLAGPGQSQVATAAGRIQWRTLIAVIIVIVLFFPIRRYAMPGGLAFELEPYRIVSALVLAAWIVALLVDPRVRLRRSGLEAPILALVLCVLASLAANRIRLEATDGAVLKKLALFVSFALVFYLIVSVVRQLAHIEVLCRILVTGGAVLGLLAIIESQTGYNIFNDLIALDRMSDGYAARGGTDRAYASAQHPIALAAVLIMILPLAVHLAQRDRKLRWWLAAMLLVMGALATISRTSLVMLAVVLLVLLLLRPRQTAPLVLTLLTLVPIAQVVQPDTIHAIKASLNPPGGLIAEQAALPGLHSSGRLADLQPSFEALGQEPILGQGFGTRIVTGAGERALLLDNQWLGTLLETGVLGALALLWLFLLFIRRAARAAKDDPSERGSLLAALAAAVTAYMVSMLTYDASSFIQVTYVLFILFGLGASLLAESSPWEGRLRPRPSLPSPHVGS